MYGAEKSHPILFQMAFVIAEHESSGTAIKGTRVGKLIISILIFLGQIQSNSLPPFF